jgi:uncharacterized protein YecE (DUF72 family)
MVPAHGDCYVMFNNIPRVADAERFKAIIAANAPAIARSA